MFKVGDTVVYGAAGVCRISELRKMSVVGKSATYYVLSPINSTSSTVFVPVDNTRLTDKIKKVMSKEEIDTMLRDKTDYVEWIADRKERAEKYPSIIADGDKRRILCMLRLLYGEKLKMEGQGKKQYITDKRLMELAERIIGDEFSYVMTDIPKNGVAKYVFDRMSG